MDMGYGPVWVYDQRVHGTSGHLHPVFDALVHVDKFKDYGTDLSTVVDHVWPTLGKKKFLVSHSMGGLVSFDSLTRSERIKRFDAFVAVAPLLRGKRSFPLSQWENRLKGGSFWNKDNIGVLTSSTNRWTTLVNGCHTFPFECREAMSIQFPLKHATFLNGFQKRPTTIKIPTLIQFAGNEECVYNKATFDYVSKQVHNPTIRVYTGARHALWQERDVFRDLALADMDTFLSIH